MFRAPGTEGAGGAPFGEGAAGLQVGNDHDAIGVQDLRRLGHEVNAREADDVRVRFLGLLGKLQGVPQEVGDVLNLRHLIEVRSTIALRSFFNRSISSSKSRLGSTPSGYVGPDVRASAMERSNACYPRRCPEGSALGRLACHDRREASPDRASCSHAAYCA